ncbi:NfeD family protein [candidate division KSB1 bacterium]|nr:NfeD family protein [candidate division KSB1 bacterium]
MFGINIWLIWFILAAFFIVGEMFTAGFFILWFGIGAAAAGLCALLGLGPIWQWLAFVVISGILVVVSRKFANRVTKEQPPGIGADRFIGMAGMVLEEINNLKNTGRVRMNKEEWRAESANDDIIPKNKRVKVIKVDGTHLIVEPIKEGV